MTNTQFQVSVHDLTSLSELEGAWTPQTYRALLQSLGFGQAKETPDNELKDMVLMSLEDLAPAEAAEALLEYQFPEELNRGQRQNLSHQMVSEKLWEEYSDLSLHEGFFNLASLLNLAFPSDCPKPDAIKVLLKVAAGNEDSEKILGGPLKEAFLVRLAADGMKSRAILHRLFDEQLQGEHFPEAEFIIWNSHSQPSDGKTVDITITSSGHWFDDLRNTQNYESTAHPDEVED